MRLMYSNLWSVCELRSIMLCQLDYVYVHVYIVEPPIKDIPNKEHNTQRHLSMHQ